MGEGNAMQFEQPPPANAPAKFGTDLFIRWLSARV